MSDSIDKILKGASAKSRIKIQAYEVAIAHRYTENADQASARIVTLRESLKEPKVLVLADGKTLRAQALTPSELQFNASVLKDIAFWENHRDSVSKPRARY